MNYEKPNSITEYMLKTHFTGASFLHIPENKSQAHHLDNEELT